jgi:hypothetical protein
VEEIIMFRAQETLANKGGSDFDVDMVNENGEHISYYDWLADSATTAHVTNQRDTYTEYQPAIGTAVARVGNTKTKIEGRGVIQLAVGIGTQTHILQLTNVLYIPSN